MKKEPGRADPLMWFFWLTIPVVVAVFLAGAYGLSVKVTPGSGRTLTTATEMEAAVSFFEEEYGRLPEVGSSAFDADDAKGRLLATILLGRGEEGTLAQNPRKIPFLSIEITKSAAKGGLLLGNGFEVLGIYDSWGEPLEIVLRKPGERGITLVHRGKTVTIDRPVVVFSKGADKIAGTKDDVKTWD